MVGGEVVSLEFSTRTLSMVLIASPILVLVLSRVLIGARRASSSVRNSIFTASTSSRFMVSCRALSISVCIFWILAGDVPHQPTEAEAEGEGHCRVERVTKEVSQSAVMTASLCA